MYDGGWKYGSMDGYGKLYYPNNKLAYEGQWKSNEFSGKGVMYNLDPIPLTHTFAYKNFNKLQNYWLKYDGDFKNDSFSGDGTMYLTNDEKFSGQFRDDMVHG